MAGRRHPGNRDRCLAPRNQPDCRYRSRITGIIAALSGLAFLVFTGEVRSADKSGVSPNSISLPKGPGSIEGLGDSFQPTLNTGTAKYSIALKVPPGTAGHNPELRLLYESGSGNGTLGFGWSLPVPYVQRQTDKGIPTYGTNYGVARDDKFINEMKEELVPQTNGFYFCENEGAFIRYRQISNYWEGTLPNGTKLEFGSTSSARIEDGTSGRIFCWLLERETDTHGNVTAYDYLRFTDVANTNQKYLAGIRYGPGAPAWENFHFVRLEYEDRPDWFEDCRAGFVVRTGKRLKKIIIGTQGPTLAGHARDDFNGDPATDNLVRRYDLEYVRYAGTNSHWSLLASVQPVGSDGVSTLPPSTFGYAICNPPDQISAAGKAIGSVNEPPLVMDNPLAEFIDFNGDGLPDVLETGGLTHLVYFNRGELCTENQRLIEWSGQVEVRGDEEVSSVDLQASSTTFQNVAHLADVDGNGLADLVYRASVGEVYYFPNAGRTNWGARKLIADPASAPPAPYGDRNAAVRTLDADFDKRIDIIQSESVGNGFTYQVWFNEGGERYSSGLAVLQEHGFDLSRQDVHIADFNGDRVPDAMQVFPSELIVTAGLGYGRFADPTNVPMPTVLLDSHEVERVKLTDINSDGLADLVLDRATDGSLCYWLNLGNYSFSAKKIITDTPGGIGANPVIRWADLNGNGTTDFVYVDGASSPKLRTLDLGELLTCGSTPNSLVAISNGIGRVTLIGYQPSTKFALDDARAGQPWPDVMPFPVTVVACVTNLDSLGHEYITKFRYHGGYYDSAEKQFRGFARVEQIDVGDASAPTLVTRSYFDTGRDFEAMKGKLLRLTAEAETGDVFTDDFTAWQSPPRVLMTGTNGQTVNYAHPTGTTNIILELGQGTPRWLESEMAYDDFGNQTLDADYGIVEDDNRSAFDDERITVTQYAINTSAWILRMPARQEIRDENAHVISRIDSFYDDETFSGGNFGLVTLGNLTLRREWIAPSNSTDVIQATRTKYDTYGNPVTVLDPLAAAAGGTVDLSKGHAREISYDLRFHTYPITETIHLGEGKASLIFQASYDEGFGTVVNATDYNGQLTSFIHDSFARLTAIVKPGDTFAYPTVEYEYRLAEPFPLPQQAGTINFIETRLLDQSPGSAPARREHYFISRQFTDGLGRALMTKAEAEAATNGGPARVAVKGAVQFNDRQKPFRLLNPYFTSPSGDLDALLAFENIEAPGWTGIFHEDGQTLALNLSNAHAVTTIYDATLRETLVTNPDGSFRRIEFKPLVKWSYDEHDTDPASPHLDTPFVHHSDGLGRLVRADEVVRLDDDGTMGPAAVWSTRYEYDLNDQLIRITDSQNNVKTFAYDGLKRKTLMSDPNRGVMRFAYDDGSNLIETTDAKSQRITYTYDGANRIRSEDYHDQGLPFSRNFAIDPSQPIDATNRPDVAYFYDTGVPELPMGDGSRATARHTLGRLAYVWDLAGEEHTSYDKRGREEWVVKSVRDPLHGQLVPFRTAFAYDSLDRVRTITYPDNDAVSYEYNRRNLPSRISGGIGDPIIASCTYLPSEQPLDTVYGNTNVTSCAYDSRMRLKELITHPAKGIAEPILHFSYAFDPVSNLKIILDKRSATVVPAGNTRRNTQSFDYDSLYRLTRVSFSWNIGPPDGLGGSIDYRYDRLGNLLSQTSDIQHFERSGTNIVAVANLGTVTSGGSAGRFGRGGRGTSDPPGPHAMTRITQGESIRDFPYDANGNVLNLDGLACVWDFKDRLVSVEDTTMRADYSYDYSDRRITKRVTPKAGIAPQETARPACVLYVGRHFEVREYEAPVKYVWNGSTRVARVTRTLSTTTNRVQRIRLARGWNLVSVAVDTASILSGPEAGLRNAFKWNPTTESFDPIPMREPLPAGSVLWLQADSDRTLTLAGRYSDPTAYVLSSSGFLSLLTREPLELTLGIPPPASVHRFDAARQRWQMRLAAPLSSHGDLPPFLPLGETVFIHSPEAVAVKIPESSLSVRFYHQDHLGSTAIVCDASGAVVEEVANYPFGAPRHQWRPSGRAEPYGFTQKERDAESRLHCVEARFLFAGSGRFLSCDKIQLEPALLETPQVLHPYSYSANRPLSHRDPDGNFISALVTAGFAAYDTYQYAVGNISGGEYAGRMTLNGAALAADVVSGGLGGGMAVRATALAARGGKVGMAVLKGAVALDRANTAVETAQAAISLKDAVQQGDLTRAGLSVIQIAVGAKSAKHTPNLPKAGVGSNLSRAAKTPPRLDALSEAAAAADRGGLTAAGRSLTKHGAGARPGNALFPAAKGNPATINQTAQDLVDDILTTPGSTIQGGHRGRFGPTIEVTAPDGRGIVYDANGKFLFFKE